MTGIAECLGSVAPLYNLVLVLVVFALFFKLFRTPSKKVFLLPWKLLFLALMVYVLEESFTVLQKAGIISYPRILHAVFEFIIITVFIYTLLIQKQYLEKEASLTKTRKRKNAK